jgi:hypothetical protein
MKIVPTLSDAACCDDCRHLQFSPAAALPYYCQSLDFWGKCSPEALFFDVSETPCRMFSPSHNNQEKR